MAAPIAAVFAAGQLGSWRIESVRPVRGDGLAAAARLEVLQVTAGTLSAPPLSAPPSWHLRGSTGHTRYVERNEKLTLAAVQPPLGRSEATRAALIPIRKSDAWWELAQDERRAILETRSRHIALGLEYLPAIARRLYHSRELGEAFDFLTWFEFAPEHAHRFEELVHALRETEEWRYVEREVDVRLSR
ncbi:MAG TPA: chlorite dismutase family protein [Polyangiales bacterium]|nr:chlorite dismutase family protein [Polyangiales bacterium]